MPSELIQILLCTCGSLLDINFYFIGEVCLFNGVCHAIVYSLFLRETMNLALYPLLLPFCFMLDLVDPLGRHYRLPFRSRKRILDILFHDQLVLFDHSLLPFLVGYFFITGRICINDVTQ